MAKFTKRETFRNVTKPSPATARAEIVGMRLNKYVAHCGICSRRQAAEHVKEGRIGVNGEVMKQPGYQIEEGDKVTYNGNLIVPEEKMVYLLMNKPRKVITTVKDERGRRTVIDLVRSKIKERIFPVGRLDMDTTGLLLLTNDGYLADKLMHPRNNVTKFYQAVLDKPFDSADMAKLRAGLELEDGPIMIDGADYVKGEGRNEIGVELHSGRNRIVRRIFEHLGYRVNRLDRVYLAGLTKKDLPRGYFRHLSEREIIMLKHFSK